MVKGEDAAVNPAVTHDNNKFGLSDAIILGVVEGITEYLPVSSTGHLLLTQHIMGLDDSPKNKQAADSYAIIIQIGAILAVLGMYRKRVKQMCSGLLGKDSKGLGMVFNLLLGFFPAAVTGLFFGNIIKTYLFGVWPVVAGWLIGGIIIFFIPRARKGTSISS
ncbi:MAG: hypothetical protein GX846_00950, partial [Deltaproteobacteria bacterium]|nr:hypothetical protein [Deltaproteobacteria bacterium]